MSGLRFSVALLTATLLIGCEDEPTAGDRLREVPQTETWSFPALSAPVEVVRTEAGIPHIYAENRTDLAFVQGFVLARDRYFMMDLTRRLGLGTITEILGESALDLDQESRGIGRRHAAERVAAGLTPELANYVDAFAGGINQYIALVKAGDVEAPSELGLAAGLLGVSQSSDLMQPFSRLDIAAVLVVVLYDSSFEGGDVGRAETAASLDTLFEGAAFQDLRRAGAIEDLYERIEPMEPFTSAGGFLQEAQSGNAGFSSWQGPHVPPALLARAKQRLDRLQKRMGRDPDVGWGSNAWAVDAAHSSTGAALLAGDGHLSLGVPSILYQLGLDTSVLADGDIHQLGLTVPGLPVVALGTNGRVAWSQTQLVGDITDWYAEELQLDSEGYPARSRFDGQWKVLERVDESYVIADVPLLDSEGRTETWGRWQTFDGRWLADIEGRVPMEGEEPAPGEVVVTMQGALIIPGDEDGDGVVSAISFDYAGLDLVSPVATSDAFGHSDDVHELREAARDLNAYSLNYAAADANGETFYVGHQATPCRGYLERDADGRWTDGSDPRLLLDGTRYGGFTIPHDENGHVDESADDPYACVVAFDETPQVTTPPWGYVVTANNDPGGLTFDGSLEDDPIYIGGPWDPGFRAATIARALEDAIAGGTATVEGMAAIQGDHTSPLGKLYVARFLESIDYARALDDPEDAGEVRIAAFYAGDAEAIDQVYDRLEAWAEAGYQAESGVETFYHQPDAQDLEDAIATTLFNAWMGRVMRGTFDDEALPGVFQPSGSGGRVRALHRFLMGRGRDNPLGLASWNEATGESVFFDVLGTDEVETSHEVIVAALVDALAFLRAPPTEEDVHVGGYGTDDMEAWLWGLRHYARFESLLADYVDDPAYAGIAQTFAITTMYLPLELGIDKEDPRYGLEWFPRPGDQFGVDAANSGLDGEKFSYGSGPVMRMVVSFEGGRVTGRNIIPGGQSSLTSSEHFSDQAALWLGNETLPMRFSLEDVIAGAAGRETYAP